MSISRSISKLMENSSWIRAMFEEGERLKKIHGAAAIFDFALGNPIAEPPAQLKEELIRIVTADDRGTHRYMPNSGYEDVRGQIADFYAENTRLGFTADHIIMTVGAAGGINVVCKALLDPGDEVIVPSPFFVEFMFYISNHGGQIRLAETNADFHLDIGNIERAINERTKAIIINSPHNPTGVVYNEEELRELAAILRERRAKGQKIYIISDEAYRKLLFDDPLDARALLAFGDLQRDTGKPEEAVMAYERAARISGFEARALIRHAQVEIERERYKKALELLEAALAFDDQPHLRKYVEQVRRLAAINAP